jgi:hypothetical protein
MRFIRLLLAFLIVGFLVYGLSGFGVNTDCYRIVVTPSVPEHSHISDLLILKGFTKLSSPAGNPLRSISKVLFAKDDIIILDAETDFQDIFRYNKSGGFINKIGKQSERDGGYSELYDIEFNAEKNEVIGFSTGNTSLIRYKFDGTPTGQLRTGSLGEGFEMLKNNDFVIYNEHNATEISGYNYLVFYDKHGNLVRRSQPYPQKKDNYSYQSTGFLEHDGETLVFSPPHCDTVFSVNHTGKARPLYIFDFQERHLPDSLEQQSRYTGSMNAKYSYLTEGVIKSGSLVLFHYLNHGIPTLGIFNTNTNLFYDATLFDKQEPLYPLIQTGDLFSIDQNYFTIVLHPGNAQYLLDNDILNIDKVASFFPELASAILESQRTEEYILLYFSSNN